MALALGVHWLLDRVSGPEFYIAPDDPGSGGSPPLVGMPAGLIGRPLGRFAVLPNPDGSPPWLDEDDVDRRGESLPSDGELRSYTFQERGSGGNAGLSSCPQWTVCRTTLRSRCGFPEADRLR